MQTFIDVLTGAVITGCALFSAWVMINISHNEKHDEYNN